MALLRAGLSRQSSTKFQSHWLATAATHIKKMTFLSISPSLVLTILMTSASLSKSMPILRPEATADLLPRAGEASCYPLTIDQAKQLPGWGKLEQWAKDNYGEGGVNIVTNPDEYTDRGANACLERPTVPLQWSGEPSCDSESRNLDGVVDGTTQTLTFKEKTGTTTTGSLTVKKSSSICTSVTFKVGFEIPGIVSASTSTTTSTTITNENEKSTEVANSDEKVTTFSLPNTPGSKCNLAIEKKTCKATAKGSIPVVASGFVWFNFEDKRTAKNDPNGGEHYKYSASIESILSPAERTSTIDVEGPINVVAQTTYKTGCTGGKVAGKEAKDKKNDPKKDKKLEGKPADSKDPRKDAKKPALKPVVKASAVPKRPAKSPVKPGAKPGAKPPAAAKAPTKPPAPAQAPLSPKPPAAKPPA